MPNVEISVLGGQSFLGGRMASMKQGLHFHNLAGAIP